MRSRTSLEAASPEEIWAEATQLWDRGKRKQAFDRMSVAAKRGYPEAQNTLGYFYDVGSGTRKNVARALYWYRRAAKQGNPCASNNIATVYRSAGRTKLALRWYIRAAAQGEVDGYLEAAKLLVDDSRQRAKVSSHLNEVIGSRLASEESIEEAKRMLRQLALVSSIPLEISGYIVSNRTRETFFARIMAPKRGRRGDEHSCLVQAPSLFRSHKEIFGVDAVQARELAVDFVKQMLGGRKLVDKSGRTIKLDELAQLS
jgi:hypothetical protein